MPIQFLTNASGETVAVQLPIDEWNTIVNKHADIQELSQWQKNLIDNRLKEYKNHPQNVIEMDEFKKLLSMDESF
jgi:hypothetical protein